MCSKSYSYHNFIEILQGDVNHAVAQAKAATIDNLCVQQTVCAQPCTATHHQAKEADIHALSELKRALDKKVLVNINFLCSSFGNCFNSYFHVPFSFRCFLNAKLDQLSLCVNLSWLLFVLP